VSNRGEHKRHWLPCFAEGSRSPCGVQCKGFVVQDIRPDQARQVRRSIEKFSQSGLFVGTYLIIHNREGYNLDFHREIPISWRTVQQVATSEWQIGAFFKPVLPLPKNSRNRFGGESERSCPELDLSNRFGKSGVTCRRLYIGEAYGPGDRCLRRSVEV
jgi:hypothetical protein